MLPGYPLILGSATADGTALTNSTTATSIMPTSAIATIPAGALQIGSLLKVTLLAGVTDPTLTRGDDLTLAIYRWAVASGVIQGAVS